MLLVGIAACYLGYQFATSRFIFDRYILLALPVAVWLALDAVPRAVALAPAALGAIAGMAVFSVGATHEYLAWNAARARAIAALRDRGVPDDEIDGGFEPNAERRFTGYLARTGKVAPDTLWWSRGERYRLAFQPDATPGCAAIAAYSYWTWPGTGGRAIHVLDCGARRPPPDRREGGG